MVGLGVTVLEEGNEQEGLGSLVGLVAVHKA